MTLPTTYHPANPATANHNAAWRYVRDQAYRTRRVARNGPTVEYATDYRTTIKYASRFCKAVEEVGGTIIRTEAAKSHVRGGVTFSNERTTTRIWWSVPQGRDSDPLYFFRIDGQVEPLEGKQRLVSVRNAKPKVYTVPAAPLIPVEVPPVVNVVVNGVVEDMLDAPRPKKIRKSSYTFERDGNRLVWTTAMVMGNELVQDVGEFGHFYQERSSSYLPSYILVVSDDYDVDEVEAYVESRLKQKQAQLSLI